MVTCARFEKAQVVNGWIIPAANFDSRDDDGLECFYTEDGSPFAWDDLAHQIAKLRRVHTPSSKHQMLNLRARIDLALPDGAFLVGKELRKLKGSHVTLADVAVGLKAMDLSKYKRFFSLGVTAATNRVFDALEHPGTHTSGLDFVKAHLPHDPLEQQALEELLSIYGGPPRRAFYATPYLTFIEDASRPGVIRVAPADCIEGDYTNWITSPYSESGVVVG